MKNKLDLAKEAGLEVENIDGKIQLKGSDSELARFTELIIEEHISSLAPVALGRKKLEILGGEYIGISSVNSSGSLNSDLPEFIAGGYDDVPLFDLRPESERM